MKIIIFLILLIFCSSIKPVDCDCEKNKPSLEEQIKIADKILLVSIDEEIDKGMWAASVVKCWKGRETRFFINSTKTTCGYQFEEGKRYLIFADRNGNDFSVSRCSRTALLADAVEDITMLYNLVPCQGVKPVEPVGCEKDMDPVCGCDGKMYGNPCEAFVNGIQVWTKGKCSK